MDFHFLKNQNPQHTSHFECEMKVTKPRFKNNPVWVGLWVSAWASVYWLKKWDLYLASFTGMFFLTSGRPMILRLFPWATML